MVRWWISVSPPPSVLHWRGPLAETADALERLVAAGKILRRGVSNLDTDDMAERVVHGRAGCQTDQILYNLTRRSPEYDLVPRLARRRMPVMAYSPAEQGRLRTHAGLAAMAGDLGVTPAQLALAWLLAQDGVIAIPNAGSVAHVRDNRAAMDLTLSADALGRLDRPFRPLTRAEPLAML